MTGEHGGQRSLVHDGVTLEFLLHRDKQVSRGLYADSYGEAGTYGYFYYAVALVLKACYIPDPI